MEALMKLKFLNKVTVYCRWCPLSCECRERSNYSIRTADLLAPALRAKGFHMFLWHKDLV